MVCNGYVVVDVGRDVVGMDSDGGKLNQPGFVYCAVFFTLGSVALELSDLVLVPIDEVEESFRDDGGLGCGLKIADVLEVLGCAALGVFVVLVEIISSHSGSAQGLSRCPGLVIVCAPCCAHVWCLPCVSVHPFPPHSAYVGEWVEGFIWGGGGGWGRLLWRLM